MKTVKTYPGQSLIDIAVQEYGDIAGVEYIIEDNNIGISDYLSPGTELVIREDPINQTVIDELINRNFSPNCAADEISGIGSWAIGVNFQIQS